MARHGNTHRKCPRRGSPDNSTRWRIQESDLYYVVRTCLPNLLAFSIPRKS